VSVVRTPAHAAISQLPHEEIRRLHAVLEQQDAAVRPRLRLNRRTWEGELTRVGSWATGESSDLATSHTVLWFRSAGSGPTDDRHLVEELRRWSSTGEVHTVAVGSDDLIRSSSTDLADPDRLVGGTFQELTRAVAARYGEMTFYEVDETGDDVVRARAVFGSTPARIITVAIRDEGGWSEEARIHVAFDAEAGARVETAHG
jgi:hypothetical protein